MSGSYVTFIVELASTSSDFSMLAPQPTTDVGMSNVIAGKKSVFRIP